MTNILLPFVAFFAGFVLTPTPPAPDPEYPNPCKGCGTSLIMSAYQGVHPTTNPRIWTALFTNAAGYPKETPGICDCEDGDRGPCVEIDPCSIQVRFTHNGPADYYRIKQGAGGWSPWGYSGAGFDYITSYSGCNGARIDTFEFAEYAIPWNIYTTAVIDMRCEGCAGTCDDD